VILERVLEAVSMSEEGWVSVGKVTRAVKLSEALLREQEGTNEKSDLRENSSRVAHKSARVESVLQGGAGQEDSRKELEVVMHPGVGSEVAKQVRPTPLGSHKGFLGKETDEEESNGSEESEEEDSSDQEEEEDDEACVGGGGMEGENLGSFSERLKAKERAASVAACTKAGGASGTEYSSGHRFQLRFWSFFGENHEHLMDTVKQELTAGGWIYHNGYSFKDLELPKSGERVSFAVKVGVGAANLHLEEDFPNDESQQYEFLVCVIKPDDLSNLADIGRLIRSKFTGKVVLLPLVLGVSTGHVSLAKVQHLLQTNVSGAIGVASPVSGVDLASVVGPLCRTLEKCAIQHAEGIHEARVLPCVGHTDNGKGRSRVIHKILETFTHCFLASGLISCVLYYAMLSYELDDCAQAAQIGGSLALLILLPIFMDIPRFLVRLLLLSAFVSQLAAIQRTHQVREDLSLALTELEGLRDRNVELETTTSQVERTAKTLTSLLTDSLDACGWWCEEIKADMGTKYGWWFQRMDKGHAAIFFVGKEEE